MFLSKVFLRYERKYLRKNDESPETQRSKIYN